jgi:hypothetical protein
VADLFAGHNASPPITSRLELVLCSNLGLLLWPGETGLALLFTGYLFTGCRAADSRLLVSKAPVRLPPFAHPFTPNRQQVFNVRRNHWYCIVKPAS